MLFKKKEDNFDEINYQINSYLEKKKFSSAISLYHKLKNIYDNSDKKDYELFDLTTNKLILLMKIDELHDLIKTKDLEKIKEILDYLKDKLKERENNFPNFYSYVEHHYERYQTIYYYKQTKLELHVQIVKIHKLMEEENYDLALLEFPETMRIYNEMSIYHRNEEIIKELEQLKSQIKMNLLKQRAYGQPAELNIRRIRHLLDKEDIDLSKNKFSDLLERI
nr:hypothetical protein [Nanoarchaeum sp.]